MVTAFTVAVTAIAGLAGALALPAAARDRVLSARDALVRAPSDTVTRTLAPDQGCQTRLDSGEGECAVVRTASGDIVVTVEPGAPIDEIAVTRPWVVRVYRPAADVPDGWQVALETRPTDAEIGPLFANVTAKAVDVTGDQRDELVLGYRSEGTGQILDIDVVGTDDTGTPEVLAHDQLYKGSVVFRNGHVVAHVPVYKKNDGNCCPTWIERNVVRYRDGEFRVDRGRRVPTRRANIPPSELG